MSASLEIDAEPESLSERFQAVRGFSLDLVHTLETEDFVVQTMPDVSPAKWHLAHVSWFFENFLLVPNLPGYRVFHERFDYLFNSYYYQVGKMHRRAERGFLSRPTVAEVLDYRRHVDEHMLKLIEQRGEELAELVTLGLHHEQQHQELMLTDIKHVFSCNPLLPTFHEIPNDPEAHAITLKFIEGDAGIQRVGHTGEGFAYDNERPAHDVLLQPYEIANRPVTNAEYREFIEDGGYHDSKWWLSDGWARILADDWNRPFYWSEDLSHEFTLGGMREINADAPVSHLSYFEADAFASWAGKQWPGDRGQGVRLPTEFEWEVWARRYPLQASDNLADAGRFHPAASDAEPVAQVWGDVWEWTRSSYSPYPGYAPPAGAVGEYNGKFMSGQFVLRGGSCATAASHIRASYRNFFYPPDRWQFTGLRLARDGATD